MSTANKPGWMKKAESGKRLNSMELALAKEFFTNQAKVGVLSEDDISLVQKIFDNKQSNEILEININKNSVVSELQADTNHVDNYVNTSVYGSENNSTYINNDNEILNIANKIAQANKSKRSKKFEETHSKQTYWIRNDILKAFNKIAGTQRGEKTRIINEALIDYFKKLEKELK